MAGKPKAGPTRIQQAIMYAEMGWSLSEIASHMGLKEVTVERYLLPQSKYDAPLPAFLRERRDRLQGRKVRSNNVHEDGFEDMVMWRDKNGIVRWAKTDEHGNPIKEKPRRKYLNFVSVEELTE